MKLIRIADINRWDACNRAPGKDYDDIQLCKLGFDYGKTPLEVSYMHSVSRVDRLWVLLRHEILGKHYRYACDQIANRPVRKHALHCGVETVETWAQRWLSRKNRTERAAEIAAETAWVTARAAVGWAVEAACETTRAVTQVKQKSAVKAARDASREAEMAAWEARWSLGVGSREADAAGVVEQKWQLALVRRVLRK